MAKVIVTGGGWSGCAAALAAAKAGAQVTLLERTDMLLGTGLVGGIFRNNGRYTAAEECIAMGGGDFFRAMDENARHKCINFPGHSHASLYDVSLIEPAIRAILTRLGVKIHLRTRVNQVKKSGRVLQSVLTDGGGEFAGDAFVDTTGTAGPMGNCLEYGNGCAMCVLRCPSFGPRVSVAAKAGVEEILGRRADGGIGAMSGSCKLNKDSLRADLRERLERDGVVVIRLPEALQKKGALAKKACTQYALPAFAENLILLDTGHAKLMTSHFPLDDLRRVDGLEKAKYEDPYAGGAGNSMRYLGVARCDDTLKAVGVENLFCGGEKSAILVGHTEAIVTGLLAGHNAVRHALDMQYLTLPDSVATGDFVSYVHQRMQEPEGVNLRYTFAGSLFFARMKERGLYSTDSTAIRARVAESGLSGVYETCLV